MRPAPRRGSRFTVTYPARQPPAEEVAQYQTVLVRYLKHLPVCITLEWTTADGKRRWVAPYQPWELPASPVRAGRGADRERPRLRGRAGLRAGPPRLYQRRVFITDQYNLLRLEPGLDPTLVLPAAI